jgi:hypothetical protein
MLESQTKQCGTAKWALIIQKINMIFDLIKHLANDANVCEKDILKILTC